MTNIHDVEQLEEQLSGPTPGQTGVAETGYGDDTMSGCCEVRGHQGGVRVHDSLAGRIHHHHHNDCLMNVEPQHTFHRSRGCSLL